ncbi:MAG: pyridoxine 5'-phosphate synthase [Omnitrophica bacterium]|nr:pyridoxine 5'-phosphate synthase [Candidatus Omnitrophota bacterium]
MPKLGVNIDHVATLRQARKIDYPDPIRAAIICQSAGADSIVCHLREDRRHIQDCDLYKLKRVLGIKLNLEMAASREIIDIAIDAKPDQVTFVPEKRMELTTEGGLDVCSGRRRIAKALRKMQKAGIEVSFFIDPDARQIRASKEAGASMIELHTGRYAEAGSKREVKKEFLALKKSASLAREMGLKVFAGHGLHYTNTAPLRRIKEIEEYNIGHSIIARAIFTGIRKAVLEMKELVK